MRERVRRGWRGERKPRLLGGGKARFEVGHQRLDRHGRDVEDRVRMEAEDDGDDDERRHHRDLPPGEVLDVSQGWLFQDAKDDAAIEP